MCGYLTSKGLEVGGPSVVASPSSVIQAILSIPSVAMVTFLAFRFVASEL